MVKEKTLYHYTSIPVLYSILKNKELWFGNTARMNDKKEITFFIENMKTALQQDVPQKTEEIEELFNKINGRVQNEYPYAMCLSLLNDDVAQWERYADNAKGIEIGFNVEKLKDLLKDQNVIFNEVFYEKSVKSHEHYNYLKEYILDGNFSNGFSNIDELIDNFLACSYLFKHPSFKSEKEIRIVTLWKRIPNFSEISCELNNGQIKQVLKVNIEELCNHRKIDFEDLIDEIVIGPRSLQSEKELKLFLKEIKLDKLVNKVRYSECPLR